METIFGDPSYPKDAGSRQRWIFFRWRNRWGLVPPGQVPSHSFWSGSAVSPGPKESAFSSLAWAADLNYRGIPQSGRDVVIQITPLHGELFTIWW